VSWSPPRALGPDSGRARRHLSVAPPVAGLPELQSWFAHELGTASPVGVTPPTPSDVIVLPGSQSGLSSIFRALVGGGQPLLMESPTYWGAITAAVQAGVRVIPVPTGPKGPDPQELHRAFDETGARMFYAQPTYANPTGAQLPAASRGARRRDAARLADTPAQRPRSAPRAPRSSRQQPERARPDGAHRPRAHRRTESVGTPARTGFVSLRTGDRSLHTVPTEFAQAADQPQHRWEGLRWPIRGSRSARWAARPGAQPARRCTFPGDPSKQNA
jgi:hypothetical protein